MKTSSIRSSFNKKIHLHTTATGIRRVRPHPLGDRNTVRQESISAIGVKQQPYHVQIDVTNDSIEVERGPVHTDFSMIAESVIKPTSPQSSCRPVTPLSLMKPLTQRDSIEQYLTTTSSPVMLDPSTTQQTLDEHFQQISMSPIVMDSSLQDTCEDADDTCEDADQTSREEDGMTQSNTRMTSSRSCRKKRKRITMKILRRREPVKPHVLSRSMSITGNLRNWRKKKPAHRSYNSLPSFALKRLTHSSITTKRRSKESMQSFNSVPLCTLVHNGRHNISKIGTVGDIGEIDQLLQK